MTNSSLSPILIEAKRLGITFIDLRLDYAFKLVFGTPGNEDLLLKLINVSIPDKHFTSVELISPEHVGLRPDSRKAVFDVFAKTSDGSDVTIEMQYGEQSDFNQRMVFYSSFPIQNNVKRGKAKDEDGPKLYYSFPNVYIIGITDFILEGVPNNDDMINQYSIRNDKDLRRVFTDKVNYITVELPKLNKTIDQLQSPADYMFYAILNIGKMKEMPEEYVGKGLDKLFELCNFAAMNEDNQRQYIAELMAELDEGSRMKTALMKGERIGLEKGMEKGIKKEKASVARAMLEDKMSPELVSKYTGLSAEEIAAL